MRSSSTTASARDEMYSCGVMESWKSIMKQEWGRPAGRTPCMRKTPSTATTRPWTTGPPMTPGPSLSMALKGSCCELITSSLFSSTFEVTRWVCSAAGPHSSTPSAMLSRWTGCSPRSLYATVAARPVPPRFSCILSTRLMKFTAYCTSCAPFVTASSKTLSALARLAVFMCQITTWNAPCLFCFFRSPGTFLAFLASQVMKASHCSGVPASPQRVGTPCTSPTRRSFTASGIFPSTTTTSGLTTASTSSL
mmetsp:Transcript_37358/g.117558  ORF Transcript_37358/g.117558 Transcript_37358/m.117558 type:complete len:251 (-) Transcript_37358:156-908(-)